MQEHRMVLQLQQDLETAKTPLVIAQAEIEALKQDLINAHRQELQLTKETDKVSDDVVNGG